MQINKSVRTIVCSSTLTLGLTIGAPLLAQQSDSAAVAEVVLGFHDYLASGDSASALRLLADDIVIVESGGIEDLEHYRTGHLIADMRFAQAVERTLGAVRVVVEGNLAWATSTATAVGEVGGREINSTSAELMVLSRVGTAWKIRAIHWSSRRAPAN